MGGSNKIWEHLYNTVLVGYLANTMLLLLGVGLISFVIGVSCAWIVTAYEFKGRAFFEWALVLPLAIPPYVAAYSYSGIFDFTSPLSLYTTEFTGYTNVFANFMSLRSLVLILSMIMYPYIYLFAKTAFANQSVKLLGASRTLGSTSVRTFFWVALPLARPMLAGATSIVFMELLNDYGAMKYYGVDTITTAICQVWFSFNDVLAATKLAVLLMLISMVIIGVEQLMRFRGAYTQPDTNTITVSRIKLNGYKLVVALFVCCVPFIFGFVLPIAQQIYWFSIYKTTIVSATLFEWAINSIKMSLLASVIAVALALLFLYTVVESKNKIQKLLTRFVGIGYVFPGAVLAIGIIIPFIFVHNYFAQHYEGYNLQNGLIIGGTIALVFGYVVRFLVFPLTIIHSENEKIATKVIEAAILLGKSKWSSFFKINLPLLKKSILVGGLLVFINVLKEIPLTIILRPFNFETLATKSFELAKNEMVGEAAGLSLIIILLSSIPVLVLYKLFFRK